MKNISSPKTWTKRLSNFWGLHLGNLCTTNRAAKGTMRYRNNGHIERFTIRTGAAGCINDSDVYCGKRYAELGIIGNRESRRLTDLMRGLHQIQC
jgi:hypothetical protein